MIKKIITLIKPVQIKSADKQAFENVLKKDKIEFTQISAISGLIIILATMVVDKWALPSILYEAFLARVFIAVVLLCNFVIASFYPNFFLKNYIKILSSTFILGSYAIEYTIYLSTPSELAFYTYFAALIVIFMILYSWTYLPLKMLLFITAAVIVGYIVAIMLHDNHGSQGVVPLLIVTISILGGATFIGIIGKIIADKHHYEKFLLQQSFKNLFEEKAKEATAYEYYANHDTLTGLPNRRFAETHLNDTFLGQIQQLNMILVVMFLDLNGFKQINDEFGHNTGDEVLKVIADRLSLCIKEKDYLVRLGGDEFLICLTVEDNDLIINTILDRIRTIVSQPIMCKAKKLHVTASIGVARQEIDGDKIRTLIQVADKRMYEDKTNCKITKSNETARV